MKKIKLTQGKYVLVDDHNFEKVNAFKWYARQHRNTWYARRHVTINGKSYQEGLHRFIMGCKMGDGKIVDHKNRNGLDCLETNLRFATRSQNCANKRGWGSSDFIGVSYDSQRKKYLADIQVEGKNKRIGRFNTDAEAAKAYDKMAVVVHGEFANLNFK